MFWSIASEECLGSFGWTVKGLSHMYAWIRSPLSSPVIQPATSCWAELPVLYSRSLLVTCFKYNRVDMSIPNSLTIPSRYPFLRNQSLFSKSLFLFCKFIEIMYAAAAAKSVRSCPTLCDPIDGSPPGSPVPGILQARTLDWGAVSFSSAWKGEVKVKSLSHVRLLATPWTAAHQASSSMGFSRQEYWNGVLLPSPEIMYTSWLKIKIAIGKGSLHLSILEEIVTYFLLKGIICPFIQQTCIES